MTALTPKQRVKVNAALASIYASGLDASAVTQAARHHMSQGHDARTGFELAINALALSNPGIVPTLRQVTRLVEASDDATVARYDAALNQYNQTGDESGLNALAPMIAQDSIALALRNGEITPEDAASEAGVEMALGFAPGDAFSHAPASAVAPPLTIPNAPIPATFAFSQPSAAANSVANDPGQRSPTGGYRAPMSAERAKAWAMPPVGQMPSTRTETGGYRAPMTGEKLARWVGIPLAAAQPAAEG